MLELRLTLENDRYRATEEFYVYPEDLGEFGRRLADFPSSLIDGVTFEVGSKEPKSYCWVRLRAYVYDAKGHTALEFRFENHADEPLKAAAQFSVALEAATLNELGRGLAEWAQEGGEVYVLEAREA